MKTKQNKEWAKIYETKERIKKDFKNKGKNKQGLTEHRKEQNKGWTRIYKTKERMNKD